MREFSVPPLVNVAPETNITDLVVREAAKASNPALFAKLDSNAQWQDIRATDFLADVKALAKGLIASGVGAGDRVGIMSRTRYEWSLVDFAIWFAGAVSVPIYETSSPSQVARNWAIPVLWPLLVRPPTTRTSSVRPSQLKTYSQWPTSGSLRVPALMPFAPLAPVSPMRNWRHAGPPQA